MLAEVVGMPERVGRRAQSPSEEVRMRIDSYSMGAGRLGELVKIAMMIVGKPW